MVLEFLFGGIEGRRVGIPLLLHIREMKIERSGDYGSSQGVEEILECFVARKP